MNLPGLLAAFLLAFGSLAQFGCTRFPRRGPSPRQLGLNQMQLWRLRKFVAEQSSDHYRCSYDSRFNVVRDYRFWATITTRPGYTGLVSIRQMNHSHSAVMYFINGRHRITALDLRPVRCGQEVLAWRDTAAENTRRRQVIQVALQRHTQDVPDSLRQRIRLYLYSRYKL